MTDKQLQEAAYYNWLNKGCPENSDLDCWLEAEKSSKECCTKMAAAKPAAKATAKPVAKKACCKAKKPTKKAAKK